MPGRYTLEYGAAELAARYGVDGVPSDCVPRTNIPPGTAVPVVILGPDYRRVIGNPIWGFVPRWVKEPNERPKPINARSETAATNGMFRDSFRDRRCLLPASGFYEWLKVGKTKTPYLFRPVAKQTVAFAGLWDLWPGPPQYRSCTILTVEPNGAVRPIHDRMPAILTADQFDKWLNPATPVEELRNLLAPFPDDGLEMVPVGDSGRNAPSLFAGL